MEFTPLQPIQVATFIIAVAILFATMYWAHLEIRINTFPYLVGPLLFAFHVVAFYMVLIGRELGWWDTGPLTIWSAYLRFHGLATMLGVILMVIYRCAMPSGRRHNGIK